MKEKNKYCNCFEILKKVISKIISKFSKKKEEIKYEPLDSQNSAQNEKQLIDEKLPSYIVHKSIVSQKQEIKLIFVD